MKNPPTVLQQIEEWLLEKGEKKFRIQQVRDAWYTKSSWDEVTTLSKDLREEIAAKFPWSTVEAPRVSVSPNDNTQKAVVKFYDGQMAEAVFMPNARGKRTVCISSQVGCAMACTFCATGTMGLKRDLTTDEIVDQVRMWRWEAREGGESDEISNIVFMGMGEPLANYEAVKEAARILNEDMGIGLTRITVSTVGPPAGLGRLLKDDDFPNVRIAISLHAGTDDTRGSIVPSHGKRTIQTFVNWVEQYYAKYGNRRHHVTLEYVMLEDVNDMPSEAEALAKAFKPIAGIIKLNLIPWNPTGTHLKRSAQERMDTFSAITERAGITTTIRYSKGLDIDAACGQLVVNEES